MIWHPRMSCEPDYASQDLRRNSIGRDSIEDAFQPGSVRGVIFGVGSERVR
jgi:hypothetical protein